MLVAVLTILSLTTLICSTVLEDRRLCWVGTTDAESDIYPPAITNCSGDKHMCFRRWRAELQTYEFNCANMDDCQSALFENQLQLTNHPDTFKHFSITHFAFCCDSDLCNFPPNEPNNLLNTDNDTDLVGDPAVLDPDGVSGATSIDDKGPIILLNVLIVVLFIAFYTI